MVSPPTSRPNVVSQNTSMDATCDTTLLLPDPSSTEEDAYQPPPLQQVDFTGPGWEYNHTTFNANLASNIVFDHGNHNNFSPEHPPEGKLLDGNYSSINGPANSNFVYPVLEQHDYNYSSRLCDDSNLAKETIGSKNDFFGTTEGNPALGSITNTSSHQITTPFQDEQIPHIEYLRSLQDMEISFQNFQPSYPPQPLSAPSQQFTHNNTTSKLPTQTTPSSSSSSRPSEKSAHNKVEKNYRNRLNHEYQRLSSKIPEELITSSGIQFGFSKPGLSKADTLDLAGQYIRKLEEEERALVEKKEQLAAKFEEMKLRAELERARGHGQ